MYMQCTIMIYYVKIPPPSIQKKIILLLRAVNPSILQLLGLLDCSRKLRFAAMASLNFCRPCRWPHRETRDPNPGKTHPKKPLRLKPPLVTKFFLRFHISFMEFHKQKLAIRGYNRWFWKKAGKMGTNNSIVWVVTIPNEQSILLFVQNFLKIPLWKNIPSSKQCQQRRNSSLHFTLATVMYPAYPG